MIKRFNDIVWAKEPPLNHNDLWFKENKFHIYNNGKWELTGGVPILNSVEELNEDALNGSLVSVVGGVEKLISISEVYNMSEEDFSVSETFIQLNNRDKLTCIKGVQISEPPKDWIVPTDIMYAGIMLGEAVVDLLSNGISIEDIESGGVPPISEEDAKIGVIVAITNPETNQFIIGGAAGGADVLNNMQDFEDIALAVYDEELGLVLNHDNIAIFNAELKAENYYFLASIAGNINGEEGTESITALNRIFKILSSTGSTDVYLKSGTWKILNSDKFNSVNSKISLVDSKVNTIYNELPNVFMEFENYLYSIVNKYYNNELIIRADSVLIENDKMKEIQTPASTLEIQIDDSVPFYKGYLIYPQPIEGTKFTGANISMMTESKQMGRHLVEFTKLNNYAPIIAKSVYIGGYPYAYTKIEFTKSSYTGNCRLGQFGSSNTNSTWYINGAAKPTSEIDDYKRYYTGDVVEVYYQGTFTLYLNNFYGDLKITHRGGDAGIFYINPRYDLNDTNIVLDTDYEGNFVLTDKGWVGMHIDPLIYAEGVKNAVVPYDNIGSSTLIYYRGTNHVVWPSTIETFTGVGDVSISEVASEKLLWDKFKFFQDSTFYITGKENEKLELTIPENFYTLERGTGNFWRNIKSIKLHNKISNIEPYVFNGTNIETLYLPEKYQYWKPNMIYYSESSPEPIFFGSNIEYIKRGNSSLSYWIIDTKLIKAVSNIKSATLYSPIEEIAAGAFYKCQSLTRIVFPEKLKNIESLAFGYCTSLEEITLPTGIDSLNYGVFKNCTSLKSIVIPKNITNIKREVFSDCNINYFDFSEHSEIPTIEGSNIFGNANYRIVAPTSLYSNWILAEVWTGLAEHIVGVTTPLKFIVGEKHYITEATFTWQEFIESNFCNDVFTIVENKVVYNSENTVQLNDVDVLTTDTIVENAVYTMLPIENTETTSVEEE